jgi:hypothetical protein
MMQWRVLGRTTLMAFPMLANVILESIGASATAALNFVLFHLSLCPLLIRLFSKINVLAITSSTIKLPFSIYLFISRKKGP